MWHRIERGFLSVSRMLLFRIKVIMVRKMCYSMIKKRCMLLHKNHPFSAGKGRKYANNRCFFVVDKIEKKESRIAHCPCKYVIVYCISKRTLCYLFTFHMNVIQGTQKIYVQKHKNWHKKVMMKHDLWD